MVLPDPAILIVTDRTQCAEPLESRALSLFRGGCRWLSLREKDLEPAERRTLLKRLAAIAEPFGATVGIHDDLDAALAGNAPLHLPSASDMQAARRALGDRRLLGKSCHSEADIAAAAREGADYVTLSPFFPTASKPDYRPSLDLAALNRIVAEATLPVLALGGITGATLPQLADSAINGIAVMGEAMRTSDPQVWFADVARRWLEPTQTLTTGSRPSRTG
jgi:thiamine-phosphate pyrophosphorylase